MAILRRLLSPINGLVKRVSSELNGRAKCHGWLIKGQAPMSWWDRGSTAPVLRESLAASLGKLIQINRRIRFDQTSHFRVVYHTSLATPRVATLRLG